MHTHILAVRLEPHDERRPWVDGRQRADLQCVEHAEHVELAFLREVGRIGKQGERDVHDERYSARRAWASRCWPCRVGLVCGVPNGNFIR